MPGRTYIMVTETVGQTAHVADHGETSGIVRLHQQAQFVSAKAQEFGGTVVSTTGEVQVVEFPSIGRAVRAAIAILQQVHLRVGIDESIDQAKRLAQLGAVNQILLSTAVSKTLPAEPDVQLRRVGEGLLEVAWQSAGSAPRLPNLGTRYELIEELGRGGMGIVYKARDHESDEIIAIKVLNPEIANDQGMIERFKSELRLARRVTHANVCRIYDIHRSDAVSYISMEYVEGESLRHVMNRMGALSVRKSVDIVRQICAGLRAAHDQGIVHRDLKPENLMLDSSGHIKIMDFGIARLVSSHLTLSIGVSGTPAYMSPEQAEGLPADARSDIYALGLILYEMVTGHAAFTGDTPVVIALKQIRETPRQPSLIEPTVPADIERVILKCLEKAADRRFQTLAEVEAALSGQPEAIRTQAPVSDTNRMATWFSESALIMSPGPARGFMILLQAGYFALYGVTLFKLDEAATVLETQLGLVARIGFPFLVVFALAGIASRTFLTSALAFNHPNTRRQYWRLFPVLLLLDFVWAASPLLLAPRIGVGPALASCAILAYLPFTQKTLMSNAFR